jgi:uncharacterized RDD family membrane protein YckC
MFCWKCGAPHTEGAAFCTQCGAPSNPVPNAPTATTVVQMTEYAGFWRRVVAYILDELILGFVGFLFFMLTLIFSIGDIIEISEVDNPDFSDIWSLISRFIGYAILATLMKWLYYALMESSKHQGTLGKLAMNLVVTDYDGLRISFGRATGRYFAKILSGMIMGIGYIMVAFTAKKQGLHDMIASTYVKKRREVTVIPSP